MEETTGGGDRSEEIGATKERAEEDKLYTEEDPYYKKTAAVSKIPAPRHRPTWKHNPDSNKRKKDNSHPQFRDHKRRERY